MTRLPIAAFERAVRNHFTNPPETWAVRKVADRFWSVVDQDGNTIETKSTKTAAEQARTQGTYVTLWHQRTAWYRGASTDARDRALTDEERAIVTQVLADLEQPAPPAVCALVVFHEADLHDQRHGCVPAVTLYRSPAAALRTLRDEFAHELQTGSEAVADDDLVDRLRTHGIHATITEADNQLGSQEQR